MIGGEGNDGVVGNPGLLQGVHQVLHGVLQLLLAGQIGPHRLAGLHSLGDRLILLGHVIDPKPVITVAGHGHIIGVERSAGIQIVLNLLVDGGLHHLQVGAGPQVGIGQLQTVADAGERISQVGMGLIPFIIGVAVVVVGVNIVAQFLELPAQSKGHGLAHTGRERGGAAHPGGNNAGHHSELAAGGGLGPVGLIVVAEHKAGVGQLIQGGRALRVDHRRAERLRRD